MKRKIYVFVMLLLASAFMNKTVGQRISGPTTVCSGQTATYTVSGPSCMAQIDGPEGLDYGTYNHSPISNTFTITWNNPTLSNVVDDLNIYVSNWVVYPDGSYSGCPSYYKIPMRVTVKPNITSVNTPTTPSITFVSGKLYHFSTYSANAANYEWVITGGTIQGSSNGSSISVIRNSECTLTARVRGYRAGCDGNVYSPYSSTASYTVPAPPFTSINGQSYIYPYSTVSYTPFYTTNSIEPGAVTSWSLSDPGGRLTLERMGNTANVRAGAPSATLNYATLTCTVSNGCGTKTVGKSIMYGGQSGSSVSAADRSNDEVTVYPVPAKMGENITLEIPPSSEIDRFLILDSSGTVVENGSLNSDDKAITSTHELTPGVYYLRLLKKNEVVDTRRILVE